MGQSAIDSAGAHVVLALLIEKKTNFIFKQDFTNFIILSGTFKPSGSLIEKLSQS